jgi:hypothetical protein
VDVPEKLQPATFNDIPVAAAVRASAALHAYRGRGLARLLTTHSLHRAGLPPVVATDRVGAADNFRVTRRFDTAGCFRSDRGMSEMPMAETTGEDFTRGQHRFVVWRTA